LLRGAAVESAGRFRKPALPILLDALKDDDATVRDIAGKAYANLGIPDKQTVSTLLDLAYNDPDVRHSSVNALLALGDAGLKPLLAREDKKGDLRPLITAALRTQRIQSPAAIDFLIDGVKDDKAEVRAMSAEALGAIGVAARVAVPALNAALNDADRTVRDLARDALKRITTTK
jgi:HEAT repeat protein